MADPRAPHGGGVTMLAGGTGGGAFVAGFGFGPLIRSGVGVYKASRKVWGPINDFLNKSAAGRFFKKVAVGYGIDVAIEDFLGLHPGPETKGVQIIWALIKGDYTGAGADLVDLLRRAEKKFGGKDEGGGSMWWIGDELAKALGRGFQDP